MSPENHLQCSIRLICKVIILRHMHMNIYTFNCPYFNWRHS